MNHLNDLLDDISTEAPIDRLDLDDVIGTGRSRVRRRRAVTGIATAAVLGVGAVLVLPGGGGSDPEPAEPAQVSALTLDDAVAAEEGRDYEVLREFTAHSTDGAVTGDFVRGVLTDGTVVVERYPNGWNGKTEIELVGPDSTQVVETPVRMGNYLGATDQELVYSGVDDTMSLLDLESLTVREVPDGRLVDPSQTVQTFSSTDGHLFISGAARGDGRVRPIYDVDLGGGRTSELARGGDVAAYDGNVAWTDAFDAPVSTVTVRDQAGGTTSFDPNTENCLGKGIGITDQRVVLMTNCDDAVGDAEYSDIVTRIDVFDLEGNPVARITDDGGFGPVRMADRFLTMSHWGGDLAGTYTYDLDTGRFLRVTDAMAELAGNETGVGSTVVWEQPRDDGDGATYVVAEMR